MMAYVYKPTMNHYKKSAWAKWGWGCWSCHSYSWYWTYTFISKKCDERKCFDQKHLEWCT
jgi:hypothetical protein